MKKAHYKTYRVVDGVKEEYYKNIEVVKEISGGLLLFRAEGDPYYGIIHKKKVENGWNIG